MIRDLYNVRWQPEEGGPTPLTEDEERRARSVLFGDLGQAIAAHGWVRFRRTHRRNAAGWWTSRTG
ncbi:hypothetical protein ACFWSF_02425 [Streptomyces sp. NPDC058611]|uniref:hypothetical protein n=1 Tax=unclassified Streptomyces TaxID=2593676 RepID=UPI0036547AE7